MEVGNHVTNASCDECKKKKEENKATRECKCCHKILEVAKFAKFCMYCEECRLEKEKVKENEKPWIRKCKACNKEIEVDYKYGAGIVLCEECRKNKPYVNNRKNIPRVKKISFIEYVEGNIVPEGYFLRPCKSCGKKLLLDGFASVVVCDECRKTRKKHIGPFIRSCKECQKEVILDNPRTTIVLCKECKEKK